jgi:hypothetical protein
MNAAICEFVKTSEGVWLCPVCKEERRTTSAPKNRVCGPGHTRPTAATNETTHLRQTEEDYTRNIPGCPHRGQVVKRNQVCQACGNKGQLYDVYTCDLHGQCTLGNRRKAGDPPMQACVSCPHLPHDPAKTIKPIQQTIPVRSLGQPWRGVDTKKPWEYPSTAIIPVVEPDRSFELVLRSLRLQTEAPYLIVIDTGSSPETAAWLQSLTAPDLEVHFARFNAVCHPSEPVSMAIDMAVARVQTRFSFFTHSDCFVTRRTALAELRELAAVHVVAGHQISPRPYTGWETEFGHTLLMCDQDKLNDLGVRWSLRDAMRHEPRPGFWPDYRPETTAPNYPDTETNLNRLLKLAGIPGFFTGVEQNYVRNFGDGWIDHVRSLASSKLYSASHHAEAMTWLASAVTDAQQRITQWEKEPQ